MPARAEWTAFETGRREHATTDDQVEVDQALLQDGVFLDAFLLRRHIETQQTTQVRQRPVDQSIIGEDSSDLRILKARGRLLETFPVFLTRRSCSIYFVSNKYTTCVPNVGLCPFWVHT